MNFRPDVQQPLNTEVKHLLNDQLGVCADDGGRIKVITAKRQRVRAENTNGNTIKPIIVTLDEVEVNVEKVIREGNKAIRTSARGERKANNIKNRTLITDDVSSITREKRRSLIPRMLQLRGEDRLAFIPFSLPAPDQVNGNK